MADSTDVAGGTIAEPRDHFGQPWWDDDPARLEVDLTAVAVAHAQPELVIRAERV